MAQMHRSYMILIGLVVLSLAVISCRPGQLPGSKPPPTPTSTLTPTSTFTPTSSATPTRTAMPTATATLTPTAMPDLTAMLCAFLKDEYPIFAVCSWGLGFFEETKCKNAVNTITTRRARLTELGSPALKADVEAMARYSIAFALAEHFWRANCEPNCGNLVNCATYQQALDESRTSIEQGSHELWPDLMAKYRCDDEVTG